MPRARSLAFATVLALGALAACGEDSDGSAPVVVDPTVHPHVFVGHVEGSKALVAIVESDENVVAYTCGQDDDRATHTGWYFGPRHGSVEDLTLVNASAGLELHGTLGAAGGEGILRLADGTEKKFKVEQARGDAGLFELEDASQWVGFIRANDGATAGSSTIRVGGVGTATESNTSSSSAVTAPSRPTTGTTPGTTIPVLIQPVLVTGPNITVITRPVLPPIRRIVTRTGPVIVFMMHGMADNIGMAPSSAQDNVVECSGPKDTPFYGRCEWGQDFLPGLFGSTNVRAQQTALDGSDATADQFIRAMENVRDGALPDENLGHRMVDDCVADPEVEDVIDGRFAKHFITPGPLRPSSAPELAFRGIAPTPPQLSVFATWRDPTRGLVFSGRRIARQIYAALRWYEATYRLTPGVILLSQSFGGLTSRFILSNPDPRALTPLTNQEGTRLCKEDLAKMDYVRDRTLFLTTLATPHEGSYLSEWGPPVKNAIRALLTDIRNGAAATSELGRVLTSMNSISTALQPTSRPTMLESLVSSIDGFIPQLENAAALKEMQLERMKAHNLTTISPERARRTAASPIVGAQKKLVPIYATLGRSPGSNVFDGPDIIGGFRKLGTKRPKASGWVTQTMLVSDTLTRQFLPDGWGRVDVAPYVEHRAILDRRARLFDASTRTTQLEEKFGSDLRDVIGAVSPWFLGKFGRTTDAVVTSMQDARVGVALPHIMVPIHTSQKWKLGFAGETAEVPIPAFSCGGRRIVIDLDVLARALVSKYRNTASALAAIRGRDLRAILTLLTVAIEDSDAFAQASADWFVGKVREQIAAGALPAECNTAPDNVFDVFAAAELLNWKVVDATGRIPVPSFIGTGEAVSDKEMDTDGAVHSASALGFTLARTPFYFEHDRDAGGEVGSWYRIYDNPVTEKYHHGMQYENEVGLWYRNTFLAPGIGPVPARDTFSVWPE